jgi:DNA-binding transcriptional LysR family regulator
MHEIMLPVCSPAYLRPAPAAAAHKEAGEEDGNTIIHLTDTPADWDSRYPPFETGRSGPVKTLSFSDYAVVVQAALLGQGIAFGWITVVSHALIAGLLVPASDRLTRGGRVCELRPPPNRPTRPVVAEIRAWIIAELRRDIEAIDRLHPGLGLLAVSY